MTFPSTDSDSVNDVVHKYYSDAQMLLEAIRNGCQVGYRKTVVLADHEWNDVEEFLTELITEAGLKL